MIEVDGTRNRLSVFFGLLFTALGICCALPQPVLAESTNSLYQQRADYKTALDHLTAGRMQSYSRLRDRLDDYVLRPYLNYYKRKRVNFATRLEDIMLRVNSSRPLA